MPLYAYNEFKHIVLSLHANKSDSYHCIECGEELRLRESIHARAHFYHVKPRHFCIFESKSLEHLHTQWYLSDKITDLKLEERLIEIHRIADCFWKQEKVVFEIQCSPITALEILQRNRDYAQLGFQVIWIFHDKRYNKWRKSIAEETLGTIPYYYTNIDKEGKGYIYSQIAGKRRWIDLSIFERDSNGQIVFGIQAKTEPIKKNRSIIKWIQKITNKILDGFEALFIFILEKSCK